MTTASLEFEAKNLNGVFADSLGPFGYLPNQPHIVEVEVSSKEKLSAHTTYLDREGVPYKVDGTPFNGANW